MWWRPKLDMRTLPGLGDLQLLLQGPKLPLQLGDVFHGLRRCSFGAKENPGAPLASHFLSPTQDSLLHLNLLGKILCPLSQAWHVYELIALGDEFINHLHGHLLKRVRPLKQVLRCRGVVVWKHGAQQRVLQ